MWFIVLYACQKACTRQRSKTCHICPSWIRHWLWGKSEEDWLAQDQYHITIHLWISILKFNLMLFAQIIDKDRYNLVNLQVIVDAFIEVSPRWDFLPWPLHRELFSSDRPSSNPAVCCRAALWNWENQGGTYMAHGNKLQARKCMQVYCPSIFQDLPSMGCMDGFIHCFIHRAPPGKTMQQGHHDPQHPTTILWQQWHQQYIILENRLTRSISVARSLCC